MRRILASLFLVATGLAQGAQQVTEQDKEALRQELGQLLRQEAKELQSSAAVNTDLTVAYPVIDSLNGFQPRRAAPLERVPQNADGWPRLLPGLWSVAEESYCLKVRTYAPADGDGYAFSPLAGPRAHLVDKILRTTRLHPDLAQQDTQLLLWCILFRTAPDGLPEGAGRAAAALLSEQDLVELRAAATERQAVQNRYRDRYRIIFQKLLGSAIDELPPGVWQQLGAPDAATIVGSMAESMSEMDYAQVQGMAFLPDERPTPAAGEASLRAADQLESWLALLEEEGAEDLWVPEPDLQALQRRWQAGGFSPAERAAARQLGLAESEIDGCLAVVLSVPVEGDGYGKPQLGEVVGVLRGFGAHLAGLPATPLE